MLKQTDITTEEKDVWMQKIQSNLIIMVLGMWVKESSGSQSTFQMVRDIIQTIQTNGIILWKEGFFLKTP